MWRVRRDGRPMSAIVVGIWRTSLRSAARVRRCVTPRPPVQASRRRLNSLHCIRPKSFLRRLLPYFLGCLICTTPIRPRFCSVYFRFVYRNLLVVLLTGARIVLYTLVSYFVWLSYPTLCALSSRTEPSPNFIFVHVFIMDKTITDVSGIISESRKTWTASPST